MLVAGDNACSMMPTAGKMHCAKTAELHLMQFAIFFADRSRLEVAGYPRCLYSRHFVKCHLSASSPDWLAALSSTDARALALRATPFTGQLHFRGQPNLQIQGHEHAPADQKLWLDEKLVQHELAFAQCSKMRNEIKARQPVSRSVVSATFIGAHQAGTLMMHQFHKGDANLHSCKMIHSIACAVL